jgi:hypothetical protein
MVDRVGVDPPGFKTLRFREASRTVVRHEGTTRAFTLAADDECNQRAWHPGGNRTGNKWGEFPHYRRTICDPRNPGKLLPGRGMKNHRPWEDGRR